MSRTRSPLAILSPPTCVASHAVVMMPKGLPTTKGHNQCGITNGEASNSGLYRLEAHAGGEQGEDGQASSAENGFEACWYSVRARGESSPHFTEGSQQANQHAGQSVDGTPARTS